MARSSGCRARSGRPDLPQRRAVALRQLDIMEHARKVSRLLLGREVAQIFGGTAGPELTGGEAAPGSQHRARREHAAAFDLAAVHDDRAEPDEAPVVEDA